jgi:hypothetical protein
MIIVEREYTCVSGKRKSLLDIYEGRGKPIQRPILNDPLAMVVTESGISIKSHSGGVSRAWVTGKFDVQSWP